VGSQETASENQWYWAKQGSDKRNGPVSQERLEELAEEGDLESEDLVWRKGFDDWKKAGSVEGVEEKLRKFLLGQIISAVRKDKEEPASEEQWHWSRRGSDERNGPVSRGRLEEMAEEGDLEYGDLVWHEGFNDWKEAGSVKEIEELFERFPRKFEIKWNSFFYEFKSVVTIYKDKIKLEDNGFFGGFEQTTSYNHIKLKERKGKEIKIETDIMLSDGTEREWGDDTLVFESSEEAVEAEKMFNEAGINQEQYSSDTARSDILKKFDVKWGGWILTSESTLMIRKNEIGLVDMVGEEEYLSYEQVEIKNTDEKEIILEAPINFNDDIDNKENHNLEFESERDKKRAVEIIERKKEELESQ
jgi:hypothetical protein